MSRRNTDFTNLTFRKTAEQDGAKVVKPKEEAIYAGWLNTETQFKAETQFCL